MVFYCQNLPLGLLILCLNEDLIVESSLLTNDCTNNLPFEFEWISIVKISATLASMKLLDPTWLIEQVRGLTLIFVCLIRNTWHISLNVLQVQLLFGLATNHETMTR